MHESIVSLLFLTLILLTCLSLGALEEEETVSGENHLELLADWMSGRFTSQEQAERDESYYNISLIMKPIWGSRKGEIWLYVEQSLASTPSKPYRQRVYKITQYTDTLFESKVYTIPDAEKFAGAWTLESPLSEITPSDLIPLPYCGVVLRGHFDHNPVFSGRTIGSSCGSGMHGAKYVESEVTITSDMMISWDKGMNEDGEQVWGPANGGYEFKKVENFSLAKE
jgi:hypothetical protein